MNLSGSPSQAAPASAANKGKTRARPVLSRRSPGFREHVPPSAGSPAVHAEGTDELPCRPVEVVGAEGAHRRPLKLSEAAPGGSVAGGSLRQPLRISHPSRETRDTVCLRMCGEAQGALRHPFSPNSSPLTPVEPPGGSAGCQETPGKGTAARLAVGGLQPQHRWLRCPPQAQSGERGRELRASRRPETPALRGPRVCLWSPCGVRQPWRDPRSGEEGTEPRLPPS